MTLMTPPWTDFESPVNYRHELTARPDRVRFLVVPERRYLTIDGAGAPGGQSFADAMAALYPVAYTLHFGLRKRGTEAPVGALEGLYWIDAPGPIDPARFGGGSSPRDWSWRLQLPVPDAATDDDLDDAFDSVRRKRNPAQLESVGRRLWVEGRAAQIMHIGAYDAEVPTIERLQREIEGHGLRARGCHHEIYISDPNRTSVERLRTLIRQPVE